MHGTDPDPAPAVPAPEAGSSRDSAPAAGEPTAIPADVGAAVEGALLYGRVADEQGRAVPRASLHLRRAGEQAPLSPFGPMAQLAQTASYAVAGLEPGPIEFHASAPGHRDQRGTIEIPAGTARVRRDFVLRPAWNGMVRVVTPDGTSLADAMRPGSGPLWEQGVTVLATPFEPVGDFPPSELGSQPHGVGRWRASGGFGMFGTDRPLPKEFAGMMELDEPRPMWLSAVLRHFLLASVRIEPGQAEATIVVDPAAWDGKRGRVRLRVVDEHGAPRADARVSCGDAQRFGAGVACDAEGRVELGGLVAGWLRLMVIAKDHAALQARFLLQPGQELDLGDVRLAGTCVVQGRCTGLPATAVHGSRFSIRAVPLDVVPGPLLPRGHEAEIGGDGAFTLRVQPGRYLVRASGNGGGTALLDTTTIGDQPLAIALQPEAPIRVETATGGEPFQLTIRDARGLAILEHWLQDGMKFPVHALPGTYRVEIADRHGRTEVRTLHLGPDGCDLRVP